MVISPMSNVFSKMGKDQTHLLHLELHFKSTKSGTVLRKCMSFKLAKQINPFGAITLFTKPNNNLFIEERLTILKNLRDKCVTVKKNS